MLNVYGNWEDCKEVRPSLKTPGIVWAKVERCWKSVHSHRDLLRCCGGNQSDSWHSRKRQCIIPNQVKELHCNGSLCRLFVSCYNSFSIPFAVQLPAFTLITHIWWEVVWLIWKERRRECEPNNRASSQYEHELWSCGHFKDSHMY